MWRAVVSARRWLQMRRDPVGYARAIGVRVGERCRFIGVTGGTFGSEPYLITIGDHVTLTSGVRFVTHDGGVWVFRDADPDIDVLAPIRVGNNVFIGMNALILPGVTIGDDCVIGAGAVVARDIPSGSVAVGNPARVLRTVAEYHERVASRSSGTARLDPARKREVLARRFDVVSTVRPGDGP